MKIINKILCFMGNHQWTCAAEKGIKPTQKQLDDGVTGFFDYATMYCDKCGIESELSKKEKQKVSR